MKNSITKHDKQEIEKLKEIKKEYLIIKNLSLEERIKRFCLAMRDH
jgi:hypothetical protein